MTALLAALTFCKANWRLVFIGLAALAALLAAGWLYERGRADEQAKQNVSQMRAYEKRTRIDEQLDGQSPRELCRAAGGGDLCDSVRE